MPKAVLIVYEAYLAAIADGALREAQVLSDELDDLALNAQVVNPIGIQVIG